MKKINFLGALIVMLFISTSVFGQTIPTTTFVQDTPAFISPEYYDDPAFSNVSVSITWEGTDGYIASSPTFQTTVSALASGVYVPTGAGKITAGFYPVVKTRVGVRYITEKHSGVYPGLATVMSRTLHPTYWVFGIPF